MKSIEAEATLLAIIVQDGAGALATAAQRAKAFLKTLNLWK